MKIAFITQSTNNLVSARSNLINKLKENGHEIVAILPNNENIEKMKKLDIKYKVANLDRLSMGLISNIKYLNNLIKILKAEKVDAIFAYTIKPIIFGGIASRLLKIKKRFYLVTGMGYVYSVNDFYIKFIRIFCNIGYKNALKYSTATIFQNKEDMEECLENKFLSKSQAFVVESSGVDMERFFKTDNPLNDTFLMVSRKLKVKGGVEYCKAAQIVKTKYKDARFIFVGDDENSFRGIKDKNIKKYIENGIVEFVGKSNKIQEYMTNSMVVVLPSYLREGVPRVLIEALAVGRPIITTNLRGRNTCLVENVNGKFVLPKNEYDLAEKMIYMLENKNKIKRMSDASHRIAKRKFDINIVNKKIVEIIEKT